MVSQMVSVSEVSVSWTDAQESALLQILDLVDQMPLPEPDAPRRGRAEIYPLTDQRPEGLHIVWCVAWYEIELANGNRSLALLQPQFVPRWRMLL